MVEQLEHVSDCKEKLKEASKLGKNLESDSFVIQVRALKGIALYGSLKFLFTTDKLLKSLKEANLTNVCSEASRRGSDEA